MTYPVPPSLHPSQSSVIFFHSRLFTPAILRSRSTLSLDLIFGLHLFSLPHCSIYLPCSLCQSFLTHSLIVSSPSQSASNYTVILVFVHSHLFSSFPIFFSRFTLYILRTQSSCLSISASVPNLYTQDGTTQASKAFPFSCFFHFLSHVILSTLIHAAAPACNLLCTSLLGLVDIHIHVMDVFRQFNHGFSFLLTQSTIRLQRHRF